MDFEAKATEIVAERLRKVWKRALEDKLGEGQGEEIADIATALRAAFDAGAHTAINLSEVPKGSILDCTGPTPVVRGVLGTLPVTKDGLVLGHGLKRLWCFGESDCRFADGGSKLAWLNGNPKPIAECYSSKEAAEAASSARAGGGQ